jgi:hypothetical protein
METVQLRFRRGDASEEQLQAALDELARTDRRIQHPEVREVEHGVDPLLTVILVTFVIGVAQGAGEAAGATLWDEYIWPRIRGSVGDDGVGEREHDPPAPTE